MKKVKVRVVTVSMAGLAMPNYDQEAFAYSEGDLVELHPELARKWIESGLVEPLNGEYETASFVPAERTVMPNPTPKRIK
jgi:hypothetical protein